MIEPTQGPGLRPLLRHRRLLRAVGAVHRRPRGPARRHLDLRPGAQPHHLPPRPDEPRDPRHLRRHPLEPGRHAASATPSPTSASISRWPIRRSTSPTGRARRCARTRAGSSARRPSATPTSPGSATSTTTSRRPASPAWCWPTARCPRCSRARATSAAPWSRPTRSTRWWRCRGSCSSARQIPACLWILAKDKSNGVARDQQPARPPRRGAVHRRPQDGRADPRQPQAEGAVARGDRPDRRRLSRLARRGRRGRLRRRARLLQGGDRSTRSPPTTSS